MRLFKRLAAMASMVSLLGLSIPFESLAAVKTITSVTIYAGLEELASGDTLPSESSFKTNEGTGNYVYANNDRYEVTDLDWITSDTKEMKVGSEPKMKVTLRATNSDEYAFKGGYQSSNVSIKGGTYVSSSRSGSDTLYVTFTFKPVKGTYESPQDADWRDSGYGTAKWSSVDNSSGAYDVYLYRGSSIIKKVEKLKATTYNFFPYMTKAGTYSFKVRTVPYTESEQKYGKNSEWTESGEVYLPQEKVSDGSGQDNSAVANGQVGWIKTGNIWYYRYPDGTYQKNNWAKINNKWYLFDSNGGMVTGWQQRNNIWYFLNSDGAMTTGWVVSNNKWYYLNQSTTSGVEGAMITGWVNYNNKWYYTDSTGAMQEGWRQVDGNWYYFYPGEGSKAVNTTISGFPVDGNGIWRK
ncbi:MAG: N-acetylmuramoyl-L-alanine amidase family protein [Lacrimispora sphenoides]|jgi:glucan-binding YG repeat protein|uniref:N-acetylmuramoyl-L-alanine amidase family protein n=1 Tax=Lacrimispora sphenoides TaxID=29370 RepID=UPI000445DC75|nr:N-acetylmuramoyl-L-alanine amidase family protein [Lacrimispora sphenoides]EXG84978.1 cell wall-binding repeat-containing protein [Clostridium sp. ASBs410]SET58529.1 Putative cell wall binding repeat-containing protein [Lacrimispora sphenoides]